MANEASSTNQNPSPVEPNADELLKETLKRCSPETITAALAFRRSGDVSLVPTVVLGIIERFLEPEVVDTLKGGDDSVKFMEDLGMDSLTMFEAIMMVEESLGVSIKNEELWDLRTVGDLKAFISAKLSGVEVVAQAKSYPIEQIAAVMPQQEPFLFLQTAEIDGATAKGTYRISGKEAFLKGHFKENPVFPASIMLEALGQLGVFHFLVTDDSQGEKAGNSIFFTGADGVRCSRVCKPGDTLELSVELKRRRDPMVVYAGKISVGGEKAAAAEEITLIVAPAEESSPKGGVQA
ncbi:phosphopantetheine-binding protein [Pelagicoccus sp. SDUM812005]|uniref:phosphopantetheine-binding protein n=1 Tax=Pelagicoccus sp. SDUM812005 TaxID=3041257 RepID=UPI00280EFA34|nr:phosphopantetheine-binding protein [Pelagicoccus sp. SDUM812005]MDQ8182979.1 phosphopantetheine-binding protein [Pelagicoccus sp. SDUM812005]